MSDRKLFMQLVNKVSQSNKCKNEQVPIPQS